MAYRAYREPRPDIVFTISRCCSIYVPNDKTFDSRKIQKFTGYNCKNGIEKSQPVPGTFEY